MELLIQKITETGNPSVVGLDPKLEYVPEHIREKAFTELGGTFEAAGEAIYTFNRGIIDAVCDIVPAVKLQSAFYEMYGWQGVRTLEQTSAYAAERGMYVIIDAKRGDIGSTAEAYAAAYLGETPVGSVKRAAFGAHALTVNAYLGSDGVKPFADLCADGKKAIFVLAKTSNASSGELQDVDCGGTPLYMRMAGLIDRWGGKAGASGFKPVGAVVGATYPGQLAEFRRAFPEVFALVPGYGAQGGGAADVAPAFNREGIGGIVNSSRGIMCAYISAKSDPRNYAGAARAAALEMKRDIIAALSAAR